MCRLQHVFSLSYTHGISAVFPPLPSSSILHPMVCSTGEGLSKPISKESGNAGQLGHFCVKERREDAQVVSGQTENH